MTTTASPHIRDWLAELDRELTKLPRDRARDLRAELVSHLDETITPADTDRQIKDVLLALGDPAVLVRDALGDAPPRPRWRRVRPRTWIVLGALSAIVATGATVITVVVVRYAHAAPLKCVCDIVMLDNGIGVTPEVTQAADTTQELIPAPAGHRMTIQYTVRNDSDVTQTVLGPADPRNSPGIDSSLRTARFGISREDPRLVPSAALTFTAGGVALPPRSMRVIRESNIEWCDPRGAGGTITFFGDLLRVRVGPLTRNERITFAPLPAFHPVRSPECTHEQ